MNTILDHFDVVRTELPNGLRVLIRADHSAPVVAIFTDVLAGYFDEPDEWVGISHVLEHMYFKGTPRRGPGVMAQETRSAGGYLNASTIYDHTSYYTVLPSSAVADGLDIQSDALLNSVIDAEELRKELLVIVQEAKRKQDNPAAVARETLYEMMFDRHRMRRWRIGREEQLKTFTRSDVRGFYEKFYRSGSTILVITGDVDVERLMQLVTEKYCGLRAGAPARDRGPAEPLKHEFRFRELSGDVVQTRMEMGWHTVPTLHDDTVYVDLLAIILGQGRASHLYRAVRDAGLASSISAHHFTPTELGIFGVSAETDPLDTEACIVQTCAAIEALKDGALSDGDVERAQNLIEARTLRGLETMEGQANFIAEWEALGDWRLGLDYLARAVSATRADIERVARHYLQLDAMAVLTYRPRTADPLLVTLEMVRSHAY